MGGRERDSNEIRRCLSSIMQRLHGGIRIESSCTYRQVHRCCSHHYEISTG